MLGVAVHHGGAALVRHIGAGGPVCETSDGTHDVGDGVRHDVVGEVLDAARGQPCTVLPAISSTLPGCGFFVEDN